MINRAAPIARAEGDEGGARNQWLAATPNVQPAQGQPGRTIRPRQTDPPLALKDSEAPHLGGKRVHCLDTPHVPHNWDAGLLD